MTTHYNIRLNSDQMQVLKNAVGMALTDLHQLCGADASPTKQTAELESMLLASEPEKQPADFKTGEKVLVEAVFTRKMPGGDVAVTFTPLVAPIWEYEELAALQVPASKVHPAN